MRFCPEKGAKLLLQRYFTGQNRIRSLSKVSVGFLLVYILSAKVNASSALSVGEGWATAPGSGAFHPPVDVRQH